MPEFKAIPDPYGDNIPLKEWERTLLCFKQDFPSLNLFDGSVDLTTQLLDFRIIKKKNIVIIVDDLQRGLADEYLVRDQKFLVRGQYYQGGLHHRISFHAKISKKVDYKDYPALEMNVVSMLKKVSNIFVAYPSDDKPVFLEIPVAGAPPTIRVHEMSIEKMKAFAPKAREFIPKTMDMGGFQVQFCDFDSAAVEGKVSAPAEDEIEVNLNPLSKEANKAFDGYLNEEFSQQYKPKEKPAKKLSAADEKDVARIVKVDKTMGVALIILKDEKLRRLYASILEEFNYECRSFENYKEAGKLAYSDVSLMVLDAQQEDNHAVDIIQSRIKNGDILPLRFVIVGTSPKEARQLEWRGLGIGVFVRDETPEAWLKQRLAKWLNIRKAAHAGKMMFKNQPLILAIDDESSILDLVGNTFTKHSYNYISASDGIEGLQLARNRQPDLVLLDLGLPKMDGLEVLRIMRSLQITKDIPVIIMTGYKDVELVQKAASLGISGYLTKPVEPDTLMARVENILSKKGG